MVMEIRKKGRGTSERGGSVYRAEEAFVSKEVKAPSLLAIV